MSQLQLTSVWIEVKDGNKGFAVVDRIERTPQWHTGWQSVNYKRQRYLLLGGYRNPLFINVSNPIKGRD